MVDDNVLAIIPARRESKRLPVKNRMLLLGEEDLALWRNTVYTAQVAGIKNIAVSTDDQVILDQIGLSNLNREVKILGLKRSPDMSEHDAAMGGVIREVMQQVSHYQLKYDTICLLQPTSPLLTPTTLKHALYQYNVNKYPCLIAVNHDFRPCGAFYILNRHCFDQHGNIWMPGLAVYVVGEKEAVDVDYIYDFRIAEAIMNGSVIYK